MSANDLGLQHQPLTTLFPWPNAVDDWNKLCLDRHQLQHFHDNGFVSGIRLLDDFQVEALRRELAEMADPQHSGREFFYEYNSNESTDPSKTLFHALGAWRVRPAFHDLLWNPTFLMAAYQLLGRGVRLFHDQLFSKPARHGGVVAWHQDYSYWTWTQPIAHLTCWIALDDVDADNGCLHYIPGSHRWGLVEKPGLAGDMHAIRDVLTPDQIDDFERQQPICLKAGEACFHHPVMMHGSYENRSDRSRRATVINVMADGVVSDIDPTSLSAFKSYPVVPRGEKMGGDYYPLLFDPQSQLGDSATTIPTIAETIDSSR